ncbi:hypothetical protein Ahy_A02g008425 isoform B [Arachis hypogaea]|uniref:Uncharacterized protein n=1 Tax=Arachis hypogaea TaxID=3818 RepID=A0A445EEB8_ARAHY|nr:hypothetical protein Ahy_A02g008425 isoform B [Arachis hypogaea]
MARLTIVPRKREEEERRVSCPPPPQQNPNPNKILTQSIPNVSFLSVSGSSIHSMMTCVPLLSFDLNLCSRMSFDLLCSQMSFDPLLLFLLSFDPLLVELRSSAPLLVELRSSLLAFITAGHHSIITALVFDMDFKIKLFTIDGKRVKFTIWDTDGKNL